MSKSYEVFKKYEVKADSLEGFLKRYTKYDRHEGRGKEYVECRIKSYQEDMDKYGFTIMSHHESVTGQVVAYYGQGGYDK